MDAHIILPPAPPRSRPTAQPSLYHPLRPLLSLPPGATRIIILSNIRRHFPLDGAVEWSGETGGGTCVAYAQ